jgi:hypothetical protein
MKIAIIRKRRERGFFSKRIQHLLTIKMEVIPEEESIIRMHNLSMKRLFTFGEYLSPTADKMMPMPYAADALMRRDGLTLSSYELTEMNALEQTIREACKNFKVIIEELRGDKDNEKLSDYAMDDHATATVLPGFSDHVSREARPATNHSADGGRLPSWNGTWRGDTPASSGSSLDGAALIVRPPRSPHGKGEVGGETPRRSSTCTGSALPIMTDSRPSSYLAPPGLIPATPRKRLPSPRAVRRRYKLAHGISIAVGGSVAAVAVAAALANLAARHLVPDLVFYALAVLVLVVGPGLPWLLVEVLWRRKRRREGWGP